MNQPQVKPDSLAVELQRLDIELESSRIAQLAEYCQRLWDWNTHINLTRHTDVEKFVTRDVWDTWQLASCLEPNEEVLDVGSGGGVPGIPLAIIRPDLQVSLCDGVGKKAKVLNDIVAQMNLPIPVYACRAEDVLEDFRFDTLVARAVGPLWKLCQWFKPYWHTFGRLLAIKGPGWVEERGEARHRGLMHGVELRRLKAYPMLGTESESTILQLRRQPS